MTHPPPAEDRDETIGRTELETQTDKTSNNLVEKKSWLLSQYAQGSNRSLFHNQKKTKANPSTDSLNKRSKTESQKETHQTNGSLLSSTT
jgi:hypothetical protein